MNKTIKHYEEQAELRDYLSECAIVIITCLMSLRLYYNTSYEELWKRKIYALINNVPEFQFTNKYPSKEFIYDNTFIVSCCSIFTCLGKVIDEQEQLHIPSFDFDHLINSIADYFDWLSTELSTAGKIEFDDYINKLKELNFLPE